MNAMRTSRTECWKRFHSCPVGAAQLRVEGVNVLGQEDVDLGVGVAADAGGLERVGDVLALLGERRAQWPRRSQRHRHR